MARKSEVRLVLELMSMEHLRLIADVYQVRRARSAKEMAGRLVRRVGTDLEGLVSPEGPFELGTWRRWVVEALGGRERRSWEGVRDELRLCLYVNSTKVNVWDRVAHVTVAMVRDDDEIADEVAALFDVSRGRLRRLANRYHGNTAIRTISDELRIAIARRPAANKKEGQRGRPKRVTNTAGDGLGPAPRLPSSSRKVLQPFTTPISTNWALPSKGDVVNARWELGEVVGVGGFGVAVLARDRLAPDHRLVLKFAKDMVGAESLWNEYHKAFDVNHRNICKYAHIDESSEFGLFLVMTFGGIAVEEVFAEGASDPEAVVSIIAQTAEGLDYLHEHDIVHGDVNPGNILVDDRRRAQVTDFGISAYLRQVQRTDKRFTRVATRHRGTHPLYSAPEVRAGRPVPASDQFSLALVFCAMIVGTKTFRHERRTAFKALNRRQNGAIARALSQDHRQRFPDCRAFAEALNG